MTDRYRIPKTIARELLPPHDQSDQFTPEQQRSRPGEDRASRDHSPFLAARGLYCAIGDQARP